MQTAPRGDRQPGHAPHGAYARLVASQFVGWNSIANNFHVNSMVWWGGIIPARGLASIGVDLPGAVAGLLVSVVLQSGAIDAIERAGGIGTVREDMAKMRLAFGEARLCSAH
jgi:hypothetical protein